MLAIPKLKDLNKLSAFVQVAERRSFTKAAQDLGTTPSVISRHMSELESSLGFSLMSRSTRGVVLTEAGEGLFRTCVHMLANIDEYVVDTRNLQTGPYGALRIKAPAGYAGSVVVPTISKFLERYPKLRIQLIAAAVDQPLTASGCDIVIASRKPTEPGFIGREIGRIHYVVCASPKYLKRHGTPSHPTELSQHNCLVNSFCVANEWPFKLGSKESLVRVNGTCSSNSSAVLTQLALDGVGIIRVPRHTIRSYLESGKLKAILEETTRSPDVLRVYFSKTKHLPAQVTSFVQFLQDSLASAGSSSSG